MRNFQKWQHRFKLPLSLFILQETQFNKTRYWRSTTNISQTILKNLDLPIPPLPEQQAIVSKIEALLSELENGKQQLQTAQQQLKVYRQSLLKCAFEGKLTNKNVKDGELPKGWKWVNIELFFLIKRKEWQLVLWTMLKKKWASAYWNSSTRNWKYWRRNFSDAK